MFFLGYGVLRDISVSNRRQAKAPFSTGFLEALLLLMSSRVSNLYYLYIGGIPGPLRVESEGL